MKTHFVTLLLSLKLLAHPAYSPSLHVQIVHFCDSQAAWFWQGRVVWLFVFPVALSVSSRTPSALCLLGVLLCSLKLHPVFLLSMVVPIVAESHNPYCVDSCYSHTDLFSIHGYVKWDMMHFLPVVNKPTSFALIKSSAWLLCKLRVRFSNVQPFWEREWDWSPRK